MFLRSLLFLLYFLASLSLLSLFFLLFSYLSLVLEFAQRVITPLVSGIVVTLIGLTLIQVGLVSMGGGYAAMGDGTFGSLDKLALAGTVLGLIILLNRSRNPYIRVASIVIAMLVGVLLSYFMV